MFRKLKKLIYGTAAVGVVVFFICFFLTPSAKAITLIPPSLEIGLKPGQAYNTVIKLFNETSDTVELYTEARSFTAKGETGQPYFDFEAEPIGLGEWIDVEEGPIVIESGKRYEVPLTINPPVDADPGGHYASLFFSSAPPEEGMVRIASKIGTLILARVDGEVSERGVIAEFDTKDSQKMFDRLPIQFFARFQNTGNVHLKPTGEIVITSMFGKESATLEFNASKGATLPDTIRKYEAIWEKGSVIEKPGNFWSDFWQGYGNERNNFAFGKYTAQLNIVAGSAETVKQSSTVSFWMIPWRILSVWAVVAALVIILVIVLIKKYNAWIIKKAQK